MAFLKGIDIILHEKVCTGKDAFNRDIFEDVPVTVSNVLVAPLESAGTQEVLSEVSLNGKGARYQLGIPKGRCDSGILRAYLADRGLFCYRDR